MSAPVHAADGTPDSTSRGGMDLASREAVIERGLSTFVDVGNALLAIREDRQYVEAGFPNFEAYCQRRWGMGRDYADRTIAAARVVGALPTNVSKPTTEGVARQLVSAPDPAAAWAESVERHGPQPTAAQVRNVVQGEVVEADPATKWFEAGAKAQRDRVSELYRLLEGTKPIRRADLDLLSEQVVRMDKLERQMLSGVADTFEGTAREIRRLLDHKLEAVK